MDTTCCNFNGQYSPVGSAIQKRRRKSDCKTACLKRFKKTGILQDPFKIKTIIKIRLSTHEIATGPPVSQADSENLLISG